MVTAPHANLALVPAAGVHSDKQFWIGWRALGGVANYRVTEVQVVPRSD
jgi:hypothetical protein